MNEVIEAPQWAQLGGRKTSEKVGYYRLKNGWITASDTQASKMQVMMLKGAQFLPQYGEVKDSSDYWGPILRHPDGPKEFPVGQILAYRWYRDCPVKVKFPQLQGVKIVEYPCPECSRTFHSPIHLGSHLRVMHEYERHEVIAYGQASNIDFSKMPGGREVIEYDFGSGEDPAMEQLADEPVFQTISPESPAEETVVAEFEQLNCECGWVNKKGTAMGLDMHRKRWCKLTEKVVA